MKKNRTMISLERLPLLLILLLSFFLNTFQLGRIPEGLHGDEAQHGLQAIEILKGNNHIFDFGWYGLPIPSFFAQAAGVWAFGRTIFALRIPSAIIGTLAILPFYFLVKILTNRKTALMSSLILATSHWWIAFSRLGENYIQVPFIGVVAFLLIALSFRTKKLWIALLAGIAVGSNFYLYFAARLTPVLAGALIAFYARVVRPRRVFIKILLVGLAGFIITIIPFVMVSAQKGEFVFSRQNDVYMYGTGLGSRWRQDTYGNQNAWNVMVGQIQRTFSTSPVWHDTSGQYGYRGWIIDPASLILIILGLISLVLSGKVRLALFPLVWLLATVFTGWILTENPPFSPRVVGAIPALALITGFGVNILNVKIKKVSSILRIMLVGTVVLCAVFYNIHSYFVRGKSEEWGDPNKYTATRIAKAIYTLPDYSIVFLTAPHIHADFGPFNYLVPGAKIVSIKEPSGYKPAKTTRTLFVVHPRYEFLLEDIVEKNPDGTVMKYLSGSGDVRVIFYQVE